MSTYILIKPDTIKRSRVVSQAFVFETLNRFHTARVSSGVQIITEEIYMCAEFYILLFTVELQEKRKRETFGY